MWPDPLHGRRLRRVLPRRSLRRQLGAPRGSPSPLKKSPIRPGRPGRPPWAFLASPGGVRGKGEGFWIISQNYAHFLDFLLA